MKPQRYLYDHGLPYSELIGKAVKYLKKRIDRKMGAGIFIDGPVGSGKTTLAIQIADQINAEYQLPQVKLTNPVTQFAGGGDEFHGKLRQCYQEGYHALPYDEAGDFTGRGAVSHFNRRLMRTFDTLRAYKIIPILTLPDFGAIDRQVLNTGVFRMLIHVERPLDKNYTNIKAYSLHNMFNILDQMEKVRNHAVVYKFYDPNIYGHGLPLEKERDEQLERLTIGNKLAILTMQEIEALHLYSYVMMAGRLHRSIIWVKKKIIQLKIKPDRVIKKVKYFDEFGLNRLAELLESAPGVGAQ